MLDWLAHPCYVNVHMASLRVRGQIMFAQTYKLPWKSGTQIRIEILKERSFHLQILPDAVGRREHVSGCD